MSKRDRDPVSGVEFVFVGLVVSALGLFLAVESDWDAVVVAIAGLVGGTLIAIGVVAVGVTVGLRRADFKRRNES